MSEAPEEESPLSKKLRAPGGAAAMSPDLPSAERLSRADAYVNTQVRGWRIVKLYGVGPITAAYEAYRGTKDATERATVRIMIGDLAFNERAKSHFLRSAYAANRFQHPRVLPILEDGTTSDGAPWVARSSGNAEPLRDRVEAGGPLPEPDVLRVAEQVLDALEIAHAHGIVHGAISPTNILLTERNSIRLCDFATPPGFGMRQGSEAEPLQIEHVGPTTAPELCLETSNLRTEQADVYAVGACLYYALTGQYPRSGAQTRDELSKATAVPVEVVRPDLKSHLSDVINHALNFDPMKRYESAYAMLGDVRRVMARRKPKLSDSTGPTPSMSASEMSTGGAPSSRKISLRSSFRPDPLGAAPSKRRPPRKHAEWRGNLILVLAIASLVGVATYVMVREKMEESRRDRSGSTQSAPR
jgi:serine/threonine protein kinase